MEIKKVLKFIANEAGKICVDILELFTERVSPPAREIILLLGLAALAVTLIRILL